MLSTSRASWWPRRTARNKISLNESHLSQETAKKWVSFLTAKKTLLVIKNPFKSRHHHLSTTNTAWGRAKKAPKKSCVSKMYQNQSRESNIKGILICESTKRKYLSVAIVNECK